MGAEHPNLEGQAPNTIEELKQTRAPVTEAKHLPAYYYTSPEIFELEKQKLFYKDWLIVGRVEEFPNPGDYKAFELVDEPVVVCRNAKGELKAFANVCRHRGVAVAIGSGNAKEFLCPYHAWVYDLDGALVSPSRPRGIKVGPETRQLPPIRLETWGGFVFINFDE